MKVKEFNLLKKNVKEGNVEGLKEVISELTLKQAQLLEDALMDLPLNDELNKALDEIVIHINNLIENKKVANKKQAPKKDNKKEPEKDSKKAPENGKIKKLFDKVKVGDIVHFRVEGEEIEHNIRIIYKGKNNIIAIMAEDEKEVFNIRKTDFNKQVFEWTDRHGEAYNILVTV